MTFTFLADENINGDMLRAILRAIPTLDVFRAVDVGLENEPDADVLAYAAEHGQIVLTHDKNTMINDAYNRVRGGEYMPGVFYIPWDASFAEVVESISMIVNASRAEEYENRVEYLPMK